MLMREMAPRTNMQPPWQKGIGGGAKSSYSRDHRRRDEKGRALNFNTYSFLSLEFAIIKTTIKVHYDPVTYSIYPACTTCFSLFSSKPREMFFHPRGPLVSLLVFSHGIGARDKGVGWGWGGSVLVRELSFGFDKSVLREAETVELCHRGCHYIFLHATLAA